ncbi:3-hydroxyacyl-CoA dehydrogenase NAD-binding domain-containing protein [Pelistega ratti]|uniref:3-hydroxyacyl-CoA dehydrogenase NAD-binding domain-containing protein n=1 Tax=Pelistega ratti TaxID=2652177 RepID=UPI00135A0D94|nr:3-hydroxyacyl-CoA dehydrogenase NAD-binding domain-containing protein [Pelistega ratti]
MISELTLKNWILSRDEKNIAYLVIDCPDRSMNALSAEVMDELTQIVDYLDKHQPAGLIIRSGKENGFIAGADINEFSAFEQEPKAGEVLIQRGWDLFNRLAKVPYPTLALIHGVCLGGGLELVLACRYRVLVDTPKPSLGLPEVMLGIYPGWGGVKRLPDIVGAKTAIDMMLTGRRLDARKAKSTGLVDYVVAPRVALQTAQQVVLSGKMPHQAKGIGKLLNTYPFKKILAHMARQQVQKKDPLGHYPAPLAILDIWEKHGGNGLEDSSIIQQLLLSPTTKNLLRVFHLQERLKSYSKKGDANTIKHVHVIGAGIMGGGIATWCALQGLKVTIQDTNYKHIANALKQASSLFARKDKHTAQQARDNFIPDPQGLGIERADIIIEAIFENLDAKHALYREIESRIKPSAILATNTSSLSLADLRKPLAHPERFIGVHFFNPVAKMPLVEVITAEGINKDVIHQACAFVGRIGKLPLLVKDSPGFLVNAVLVPYMLEAMRCVDEGIEPEVIDTAMLKFGMPMGPIELADTVGLDIAIAAGTQLSGTSQVPSCLTQLVDQHKLGKKTGEGFYQWKNRKTSQFSQKDIPEHLALRLITPFINQAQAQLDKGIIEDADLVDAGIIFGTGFAPFRGGPLNYRKTIYPQ